MAFNFSERDTLTISACGNLNQEFTEILPIDQINAQDVSFALDVRIIINSVIKSIGLGKK